MKFFLVIFVALLSLGIRDAPTRAQETKSLPHYVGSETCASCHEQENEAWERSHHASAWMLPDEASVQGDFNDAVFVQHGITTRFTVEGSTYFVEIDGPDGELERYQIIGVAGVFPLQQYLVEIEPGRVQALDVAWDVAEQRWYNLYPDQVLRADDGLHWTGPYKSWNGRCAECHATDYSRNYDERNKVYTSTQAEIGVGCEACHGPGEAHIAWAVNPASHDQALWPDTNHAGLLVTFGDTRGQVEIQQCAGCHSRREPLLGESPVPGTPFHDAYRLALLRDGLYYADGTIRDEVYVYGSFLQSKMHERGVRCSDCHEPHSGELRADGNAVCTQCHSPAGNDRFPTLTKALYDDPAHHFHQAGSEGAQCKNCHMPERTYMGIDKRSDHSFRVPRPDLFATTGAPDTCTDCHTDRDAEWAAVEIAAHYPNSEKRGLHFSETFSSARDNANLFGNDLLDIALHESFPGIVRASALDLARPANDSDLANRAEPLIDDNDALVRAAAIALQRAARPVERVQRLLPALKDPIRSVRIAAARELLDAPIASMPQRYAEDLRNGMAEWRRSLIEKADFPEAHLAIGGAALVLRNPKAAELAFREAVRLDPQAVDAWVMITRIRAALGDTDGAIATLEEAAEANPDDINVLMLKQELGATTR